MLGNDDFRTLKSVLFLKFFDMELIQEMFGSQAKSYSEATQVNEG